MLGVIDTVLLLLVDNYTCFRHLLKAYPCDWGGDHFHVIIPIFNFLTHLCIVAQSNYLKNIIWKTSNCTQMFYMLLLITCFYKTAAILNDVRNCNTRSSATAKSPARPSCLIGVLYGISWEKIWAGQSTTFTQMATKAPPVTVAHPSTNRLTETNVLLQSHATPSCT